MSNTASSFVLWIRLQQRRSGCPKSKRKIIRKKTLLYSLFSIPSNFSFTTYNLKFWHYNAAISLEIRASYRSIFKASEIVYQIFLYPRLKIQNFKLYFKIN